MKLRTFLSHAVLFLLFTLSVGCRRPQEPAEEKSPAPVKWIEARQLFLQEWTEIVGTTQALPSRTARVTAPVEGRVMSVLHDADGKPVIEGQQVKKGTVIALLDSSIAEANRDKSAAAQDELKQQIRQAELDVKLADIEVRTKEELSRKNPIPGGVSLVSPIELDRARVALETAQSKQKAAELRQASGAKELKALNEQLKLYTLTAPIDGRLGRLLVAPGQTLAVGSLVSEVLDLEQHIDVLCFVAPHVAERLKDGQKAQIGAVEEQASPSPKMADEDKDGEEKPKKSTTPEGKIVYIAEQAEADTGNFAVKVRFGNSGLGLRMNTVLRLRVLTHPGKACLSLPDKAVMEDVDPPSVIVVENHDVKENPETKKDEEVGVARKLRVKIGLRDQVLHAVEILGLDDKENKWKGDLETAKFVIERGQGLKTGDTVKLEEEDEDEEPMKEEKP